jgi:hypothetical protein
METDLLKTLGQIAGIGGISLGVFLLLFRDLIRKKIFPTLTKDQAFRLLRLIAILVWSVAIVGIGAWIWGNKSGDVTVKNGVGAGGDINVKGDIRIEGSSDKSDK